MRITNAVDLAAAQWWREIKACRWPGYPENSWSMAHRLHPRISPAWRQGYLSNEFRRWGASREYMRWCCDVEAQAAQYEQEAES